MIMTVSVCTFFNFVISNVPISSCSPAVFKERKATLNDQHAQLIPTQYLLYLSIG